MKIRFIVLVDFSFHSARLLKLSYNWAGQVGAGLLLVHQPIEVIPGMGASEVLYEIKKNNADKAMAQLKRFAASILGDAPTIGYLTETEHLVSALQKVEDPKITDFIFVGINEKTTVEKLLVGYTAISLANDTEKIIVALPTSPNDFYFDTLHIAVRLKFPVNNKELRNLLSIKNSEMKQIRFFSVIKSENEREEIEKYLEQISEKYGKSIKTSFEVLANPDPMAEVKRYMMENKGILVIQKGSRSMMDVFRKFFTTEVIHHARVPVIVLP